LRVEESKSRREKIHHREHREHRGCTEKSRVLARAGRRISHPRLRRGWGTRNLSREFSGLPVCSAGVCGPPALGENYLCLSTNNLDSLHSWRGAMRSRAMNRKILARLESRSSAGSHFGSQGEAPVLGSSQRADVVENMNCYRKRELRFLSPRW
jgi:hypothetical protein